MRPRPALAVVSAMVASVWAVPPAQAAPAHSPGYPAFAHEGRYPEQTPCAGGYKPRYLNAAPWGGGGQVRLQFWVDDRCGAFARIDNAPRDCEAVLERSTDGGRTWEWVKETVDPGLDFAYTMVSNNLDGRKAQAVLICGGQVLANTGWH